MTLSSKLKTIEIINIDVFIINTTNTLVFFCSTELMCNNLFDLFSSEPYKITVGLTKYKSVKLRIEFTNDKKGLFQTEKIPSDTNNVIKLINSNVPKSTLEDKSNLFLACPFLFPPKLLSIM